MQATEDKEQILPVLRSGCRVSPNIYTAPFRAVVFSLELPRPHIPGFFVAAKGRWKWDHGKKYSCACVGFSTQRSVAWGCTGQRQATLHPLEKSYFVGLKLIGGRGQHEWDNSKILLSEQLSSFYFGCGRTVGPKHRWIFGTLVFKEHLTIWWRKRLPFILHICFPPAPYYKLTHKLLLTSGKENGFAQKGCHNVYSQVSPLARVTTNPQQSAILLPHLQTWPINSIDSTQRILITSSVVTNNTPLEGGAGKVTNLF